MVQREVAERIAAPPGRMSYLSVFVQYHARVRVAFLVPADAFEPEPAVESAVIVVEPYPDDDRAAGRRGGGRALAPRPGLLPRAAQDAPQRPVAAAPRRAGTGRRRARDRRDRPGPATPDRRGRGVARAPRGVRRDRPGHARDGGANDGDRGRRPAALAPVVRLAPAKLNLTLAVVGRRPDGYHALHSVMVPLALADRLSVAVAARRRRHAPRRRASTRAPRRTTSSCGRSRWPARRSAPSAPRRRRSPAAWRSGSRSPPGSPAARATRPRRSTARSRRGAPTSTRSGATRSPLRLGSDVPFFLVGAAALVEGRGERVTPLHGVRDAPDGAPEPPGILLVTPAVPAHTAAVFAAWSGRRDERAGRGPPDVGALRERVRVRADRPGADRAGRRARVGQRPVAGRGRGRAGPRVPPPRAHAAARPADRAVRLRPDALGALSFAWARRKSAAAAVEAALDAATLTAPGDATAVRRRDDDPSRTGGTDDPTGDLDRRRRRGDRAVQPGDPQRRHAVLLGPARASTRRPASSSRASRPRPSAPSATSSRSSTRPGSASTMS